MKKSGKKIHSEFNYLRFVFLAATVCFVTYFSYIAMGSVQSRFAGKILVLKKRPPSYFKSQGGFVKFLRRNKTNTVYENQDKEWVFETMAFFRRKLGDYEVQMAFYDIENGRGRYARRFVDGFPQYTQDRNTRSLAGKVRLTRPQFDANKRYLIVVISKGDELATGEVTTRGTSQEMLDQQLRIKIMQKDMEKQVKEMERKAKEQEEMEQKKKNNETAGDLF